MATRQPEAEPDEDGRETNSNKRAGTMIEEHREDARGGERTPEAWFDVEDADGTLVEVKSTMTRLNGGRRGRYQISRTNHENMLDHGGVYDFVLRSEAKPSEDDLDSGAAIDATRLDVPASTVEEIRQEHDLKWPDAGKLKLPWSYVHDEDEVEG